MKTPIVLLPASCFLAFLHAEPTATEKSLATLRDQRAKAVADATTLIDRRYRAELEALQKRATQSGDLDGALRIRDELVAMEAPVKTAAIEASVKVAEAPVSKIGWKAAFMAKKWKWGTGSSAEKLSFHGTLEFLENGKVRKSGEVESFIGDWEYLGEGRIRVKHVGSNSGAKNGWTFKYDDMAKNFRSLRSSTSMDAEKWLVQSGNVSDDKTSPESNKAPVDGVFGRKAQ